MVQGGQAFSQLWFGFDTESLFLRLDPEPGNTLKTQVQVALHFSGKFGAVQLGTVFPQPVAAPLKGVPLGNFGTASGIDIMEVAVPIGALGARPGDRVELSITVMQGSVELQRVPPSGVLALVVPGADFDRVHWKV